jgi:hypothetical protein
VRQKHDEGNGKQDAVEEHQQHQGGVHDCVTFGERR